MRIFLFFSLFFILLVGTLAIVHAQEGVPKYNLGSMQSDKSISIKPGQETSIKLYFYNIDGNRPTHIKLSIVEKPANWDISISPSLQTKEYEVSGVNISVDENLVVYPSNASVVAGQEIAGKEWISSKVGYINADYVTISIKVPENEKIGITDKIKINAIASWLGQAGSIALQQERDFEYSVTTTTTYYEKPVGESVNQTNIGKQIISLFTSQQIKPIYMIATGTTLILIIAFVILVIFAVRKRRKRRK